MGKAEKASIKDLISKNSAETYSVLRRFYIDVISGNEFDTKITKEGEVISVPPTIAVKVEAAAALQRMDIDKIQGNAKSRETEESQAVSAEALSALSRLAEAKKKK